VIPVSINKRRLREPAVYRKGRPEEGSEEGITCCEERRKHEKRRKTLNWGNATKAIWKKEFIWGLKSSLTKKRLTKETQAKI